MFKKFFNKEKQNVKIPVTENVDIEKPVEEEAKHPIINENLKQKDFVEYIIDNFESFERGLIMNTEYSFFEDKDILITIADTMYFLDLSRQDYNIGIPILHQNEFKYYIRSKQCKFTDKDTLENLILSHGVDKLEIDISAFKISSHWKRLFDFFKENNLRIQLKVLLTESYELNIFVKVFKVEEHHKYEYFNDIKEWSLINQRHRSILSNVIESVQNCIYSKSEFQKRQYILLREFLGKVNKLNLSIKNRCIKDDNFEMFFNTVKYNYNNIWAEEKVWIEFNWNILDTLDSYMAFYKDNVLDSDQVTLDTLFLTISSCLIGAANQAMEIFDHIDKNYNPDTYIDQVIDEINQDMIIYNERLDQYRKNTPIQTKSSLLTRFSQPEIFIKNIQQIDRNPDWEQINHEHNNKITALHYLSYMVCGSSVTDLYNKLLKDAKSVQECFDANKSPYMAEYYSYLVCNVIINRTSEINIPASDIPFIYYIKNWNELNKKEIIAIKIFYFFTIAAPRMQNILKIDMQELFKSHFSIIYNNGNVSRTYFDFEFNEPRLVELLSDFYSVLENGIKENCMTPENASETIIRIAISVIEKNKFPYVSEQLNKIIGISSVSNLKIKKQSDRAKSGHKNSLQLGFSQNNEPYIYKRTGSIVTIAPPRSGKSRCQVIPNLKQINSSVVVIDPKGECFDETEIERNEISGSKVYKFAPFDSERSDIFNPLEFLSSDNLWEDSKLLAGDIIPQLEGKDDNSSFFRDMAVDYLAAVICTVKVQELENGDLASFSNIADKLLLSELESLIDSLKNIKQACRVVNRLKDQPEGTLQGVLSTTQRAISCWEDDSIEKATSGRSNWTPVMLKDTTTSIFICFPPAKIETYSSVIRVIISMHLRELFKDQPEYGKEPDVVFFLDELPLLGYMRPVEDAVFVGAGYGVRAWLFAQSVGQLTKHYTNAEGLIGSCDTRCFMNPSQYEKLAQKVSDDIGFETDVISGEKKPKIEPQEISGEKYKDNIFIFSNEYDPVIINKRCN